MDPVTAKLIAAAEKVAEIGVQQLPKVFDDYARFWKHFEKAVKGDQNVPWQRIEDRARYDPQFVGIARGVIEGNAGSRDALREYLDFVERPVGAHEDLDQIKTKLYDAAIEAANKAPLEDRAASLADRRHIEATVQQEIGKVMERIEGAESRAAAVDVDRLAEQIGERFAAAQAQQRAEAAPDAKEDVAAAAAAEGTEPPSAAEPVSERAAPSTEQTIDELLAKLEKEDSDAASEVREVLRKRGTHGVLDAIRDGKGPRTLAALATEAAIVAREGFFAEAERAYRDAAEATDDARKAARQLVRAASMAKVQGADARFGELLDKAERLAPGHPGVAIAEARASSDPEFMLERLADVEPENETEEALLHVTRGQAELALGNKEPAVEELGLAEIADSKNAAVREFKAIVPWLAAKDELSRGLEPDPECLREAARGFTDLAAELRPQRRLTEVAHLTARAAESYALAGDTTEAAALLEEVDETGDLDTEARAALGEAAMAARRPDLVDRFVTAEDTDPQAQLLWADAQLLGDADADTRTAAVEALLPLLGSDDEALRQKAAFALLAGAATNDDVEWNERAAEIVRAAKPVAEAVMRAERLRNEGDEAGAEAALLAHGTHPPVLRQLRDLAAQQGDWAKARDRSRDLWRITNHPRDRLMLAEALRRSGDEASATEEFLTVARDPDVDDGLRGAAYGGAVEIAAADRGYAAVRDLAQEWHRALPGDANGLWNLLFVLARLASHDRAYALVQEEDPDPNTPERAALLAEVLYRAAPTADALRRIAELSDRYGRKQEALEGLFIQTVLSRDQRGEEVPEDLVKRFQETLETFPERFPDQQFMRVIEAPSSAEEFVELMNRFGAGDRAMAQKEAVEQIIAGRGPVNTLAAIGPTSEVGPTWLRLGFLPLGFAMPASDAADREAVTEALGGAVVWDSSALFISGGLGADHAEQVRGAFPASVIAEDVLEDADAARTMLPREGQSVSVHDPDTGEFAGLVEYSPEEVARHQAMAKGMLDLAKRFETAPGLGEESDSRFAELYEGSDQRAFKGLIASLALAERRGLPIFSDDRWVREAARSFGIPAFGTVALLDVLAERGVIGEQERRQRRGRLMESRAWGIQPTGEELVEAGKEGGWLLTQRLTGAFHDRAMWRSQPAQYWLALIAFLQAVCEEAPERLRVWLRRAIDGSRRATPEMPRSWPSEVLLLMAWNLGSEEQGLSDPCFRRVVNEVKHLPPYLRDVGADPVNSAIASLMELFAGQPREVQGAVFRQIIRRLGPIDAAPAMSRFLR